MDFGTLLSTAQRNEHSAKKEVRYYSTKFEPPKKEQRNKSLSANIKNFLAKKEAEEKRKSDQEKRKRDELLALRSKDKKATRRVNVMLKRTKSANQSVIQDAVDQDNTAVTLAGPSQPDEDDYGYVSQEAAAFYNKMMEKYSKMPDEPKFSLTKKKVSSNLNNTKDRVRTALDREKEEAMLPHRRKRKHREENEFVEEKIEEQQPSKPKAKPMPPPMNFAELLKVAEKKQFEPIVIEPKVTKDVERPLTKKQKKEFEREKEWKERKESKTNNKTNPLVEKNRIPKVNSKPQNNDANRIPKLNGNNNFSESNQKNQLNKIPKPIGTKVNGVNIESNKTFKTNTYKTNTDLNKTSKSNFEPNRTPKLNSTKPPSNDIKIAPNKTEKINSNPSKLSINKTPVPMKAVVNNYKGDGKPKPLAINDKRDMKLKKPVELPPKQFPPKDLKPKQPMKPKPFPPADVRGRDFPPRDVRRKPLLINKKRRILDDDDEEYDSEMDDFIDDGPEEQEDYSKYISEIFGYDKSRYKFADEDIDNMESSFTQQMKEEIISTKIGIMEDLEDMKKEEEEKRKKALMKKRR